MKQEIVKEKLLFKIIKDFQIPINAQIQAIDSFLINLNKDFPSEELDLLKLTQNSCFQMQKQIENIVMSENLLCEKLKLNYELFDLAKLIKEIIEDDKILLKYNELEIIFLPDKDVSINADKLQIKKCIENIIYNSIVYSYKTSKIFINLVKEKNNIIFQLKNNSPHIQPNNFSQIFLKYKTIPINNKKTGLGLGLYITKEIIEAHGGKMIAFSYENDINIFGFAIPM